MHMGCEVLILPFFAKGYLGLFTPDSVITLTFPGEGS